MGLHTLFIYEGDFMREEEMVKRYKGIVISVWNKYFNDCTAIEKEDLDRKSTRLNSSH